MLRQETSSAIPSSAELSAEEIVDVSFPNLSVIVCIYYTKCELALSFPKMMMVILRNDDGFCNLQYRCS